VVIIPDDWNKAFDDWNKKILHESWRFFSLSLFIFSRVLLLREAEDGGISTLTINTRGRGISTLNKGEYQYSTKRNTNKEEISLLH
jgi:hypothetical protein